VKNYRVGWVTSIPITGFPQEKPLGDFPAQVKDRFTPGAMVASADLKPVGQVELQRYTAVGMEGSWPRFQKGSSNGWMGICLG